MQALEHFPASCILISPTASSGSRHGLQTLAMLTFVLFMLVDFYAEFLSTLLLKIVQSVDHLPPSQVAPSRDSSRSSATRTGCSSLYFKFTTSIPHFRLRFSTPALSAYGHPSPTAQFLASAFTSVRMMFVSAPGDSTYTTPPFVIPFTRAISPLQSNQRRKTN